MTEPLQARAMSADEQRELQKKLDEVNAGIESLRVALEDIQAFLTPCYGEKDSEFCIRPDHHRGPHLSAAGTEWVDDA